MKETFKETFENLMGSNFEELLLTSRNPMLDNIQYVFHEKKKEYERETNERKFYDLWFRLAQLKLGKSTGSLQKMFDESWLLAENKNHFSDDELLLLLGVTDNIENDEIKSRINDIIWETKNRTLSKMPHEAGKDSVKHYIRFVKSILDERFLVIPGKPKTFLDSGIIYRLKRAYLLADKFKINESINEIQDLCVDIVENEKYSARKILRIDILKLLIQIQSINAYVDIIKSISEDAEKKGKWNLSRWSWDLLVDHYKKESDPTNVHIAQVECSNVLKRRAIDRVDNGDGSKLAACTYIKEGLIELRKLGNTKEVRDEYIRLYGEYMSDTEKEFVTITSDPIEIPRKVLDQISNNADKGNLKDSIAALAKMPFSEKIIEHLSVDSDKSWIDIIVKKRIAEDGRTTTTEKTEIDRIFEDAIPFQSMYSLIYIERIRKSIIDKYEFEDAELLELLKESEFIPKDRLIIYLEGVKQGFRGNYLIASHLLFPQIENSIRHILKTKKDYTIISIDDEGKDNVKLIGVIINTEELKELLGIDTYYDLRGFLHEKWGSNLRNKLAHGLVKDTFFSEWQVIYLWWLTLKLIFMFRIEK